MNHNREAKSLTLEGVQKSAKLLFYGYWAVLVLP